MARTRCDARLVGRFSECLDVGVELGVIEFTRVPTFWSVQKMTVC